MTPFGLFGLGIGLILKAKADKEKAKHEQNKALVDVVAHTAYYLGQKHPGRKAEDYVSPLWYNLVVKGMTLQEAIDTIENDYEELRTRINRIDIVY